MTHFERLGLPIRFALDASQLERMYLAKSREVHPDFHSLADPTQQQQALEQSSQLNEAYAVLKDDWRRADYLLHLLGGPSAAEAKQMPGSSLAETLDLREQIAELHATTSPHDPRRMELEQQLLFRREALMKEVADRFAQLESTGNSAESRQELRQLLNAVKFLDGLIRDLESE